MQPNFDMFCSVVNCPQSYCQLPIIYRPIPQKKCVDSQNVLRYFEMKPPKFNKIQEYGNETNCVVESDYNQDHLENAEQTSILFNQKMRECSRYEPNSEQTNKEDESVTFGCPSMERWAYFKNYNIDQDHQKNKPRHYENREEQKGSDGNCREDINYRHNDELMQEMNKEIKITNGDILDMNEIYRTAPRLHNDILKNGKIKSLQYKNSTSHFATRCDVVYKTLMRDCRKYFAEELHMKSMRKSKKLANIGGIIDTFVRNRFIGYQEEVTKQLKFYLGCLVYPKEMISSKVGLKDDENRLLVGAERKEQVKKIEAMHQFMYNFSMKGCEEFFSITSIGIIFREYSKRIEERFTVNETMNKNREVYENALNLIESKLTQHSSDSI